MNENANRCLKFYRENSITSETFYDAITNSHIKLLMFEINVFKMYK